MEGCGEGALGSLLPQGDGNEVCVHQPSVLWGFLLQNELAEKAVNDLAAVYGTKYTYGSIIDTICEFLPPKKIISVLPPALPPLTGAVFHLLSPQTWHPAPPWTGPTRTG